MAARRVPLRRTEIESSPARPLAMRRSIRRVFSRARTVPITGNVRCRRSGSTHRPGGQPILTQRSGRASVVARSAQWTALLPGRRRLSRNSFSMATFLAPGGRRTNRMTGCSPRQHPIGQESNDRESNRRRAQQAVQAGVCGSKASVPEGHEALEFTSLQGES